MPIARVQLPDGRIGKFEVPDGTTEEQVLSFIQGQMAPDKTAPQSAGRTAVDQALQGATFGLGDEIAGAIGGVGAKIYDKLSGRNLFEDQSAADVANMGIDQSRLNLAAQTEESPVSAIAAQLGGGVLTGAAGMATKAGGALASNLLSGPLGVRALKGAAAGAASGAGYGAGTAEGGIEDRLAGAKEGAETGAMFGAAFPVAGAAIKGAAAGVPAAGRAVKTLITGRDADQILATRLREQNLPELRESLRTGSDILALGDVAGDEIKGLMRVVGRTPGGAKDVVTDFLETRSEDSIKRVSDLLSKNVSNVDAYFGNLDDVAKARATMSAPLYKTAFEEAPSIQSPELVKFMQDKRVIDAMDQAKKSYGVRVEAPANSLETLDGVKKVFDDIAGEAYRSGKNQLGASYTKLKQQLVPILDEASPTYKKARETFAGFSALEEAQLQGSKFSSLTPEQLQRTMKGLTQSEREAFRIGVRENLQNTVSKTADGADPAKKIFGNSFKREQLQAIFGGNTQGFKDFARRLNDEMLAADTKFKVLGGSRTDINLAEDGAPLVDAAVAAVKDGKYGLARKITDAVGVSIQNRFIGLTPENSKRLAQILTNKELSLQAIDRIMLKNAKNEAQKRLIKEVASSPEFTSIKRK